MTVLVVWEERGEKEVRAFQMADYSLRRCLSSRKLY